MFEIVDEMWFNNLWIGLNSNKLVNVIYFWFLVGVIRYRLCIKIEIICDDKKKVLMYSWIRKILFLNY